MHNLSSLCLKFLISSGFVTILESTLVRYFTNLNTLLLLTFEILKKRFAGGEITKDEFIEMKTLLE